MPKAPANCDQSAGGLTGLGTSCLWRAGGGGVGGLALLGRGGSTGVSAPILDANESQWSALLIKRLPRVVRVYERLGTPGCQPRMHDCLQRAWSQGPIGQVFSIETAGPREYGFYSNVNPTVDHPRWSQASERRIGDDGLLAKKRPTLMFNGYEPQVGQMYTGMDLNKFF